MRFTVLGLVLAVLVVAESLHPRRGLWGLGFPAAQTQRTRTPIFLHSEPGPSSALCSCQTQPSSLTLNCLSHSVPSVGNAIVFITLVRFESPCESAPGGSTR